MRASARIEVARRDGRDVLVDVRSEPPLAIRSAGGRVLVVSTAASPVGGDAVELDAVVGAGARLSLGTVAATIAWPGPHGGQSHQRVDADVGAGGHLCWTPEPLIAVAGCHHRSTTTLRLAAGAAAWIVEEVSLGRTGEVSGHLELEWRVERDGRVLVHHAERLGPDVPGWGSAVTTGGHRHLIAALRVGGSPPSAAPEVGAGACAAVLALADDAWMLLATGATRVAATALVTRMAGAPRDPVTEADPSRRPAADPASSGRPTPAPA